MGVFNILNVIAPCENCSNIINRKFQFKYGTCDQSEYFLGDQIKWGGHGRGVSTTALIATEIYDEECPIWDFAKESSVMYVRDGSIVGVGPNDGKFNFHGSYDVKEAQPFFVKK